MFDKIAWNFKNWTGQNYLLGGGGGGGALRVSPTVSETVQKNFGSLNGKLVIWMKLRKFQLRWTRRNAQKSYSY